MLPFQFKIKGYLNETGEYTEYFPAESATIIQLILQHWFNDALPNNLDIVAIRNEKGDQLVIDHVKRDIFDYYLLTADESRDYYHKKTDIQFMFFVLENFFNHNLVDLKMNLTQRREDWRFIRGDFTGKNFTYAIDRKSLWRNLSWLWYQVAFLIVLAIASIWTHPVILLFVAIYLTLILFSASKVRVYRQYYMDNKDLEVKLSRADNLIHVKNGSWTKAIPKADIKKVTKFILPPEDARSQAELYTEVEFFNGNVLNLTCLLLPQINIENKFANEALPFEVEIINHGSLKRKTDLDQYFSAIRPLGVASSAS